MTSKRKQISTEDLEQLAMKLRRENMVATHKAYYEEMKIREMIKASEKIRNRQNEYGNLYEAHSRLSQGLQGPALERMHAIGSQLNKYKRIYGEGNFPRQIPFYSNNTAQRILL